MSSKTYTALLIDDEANARELLSMMLISHPEIRIGGEAGNAREAMILVRKHRPDLIFLDIQMPGKTGFDLLREIREEGFNPGVVFVTAFDEFAVRAFKVAALDYLVKPVHPDDLAMTIARFRINAGKEEQQQKLDHLLEIMNSGQNNKHGKIRFNTSRGFLMINPADILYVTADWNYTEIYLTDGTREVVSINLGNFEKMIPDNGFFRVSRSALINLRYLKKVDKRKQCCELNAGQQVISVHIVRDRIKALEEGL